MLIEHYALIKAVHVHSVALSLSLFALRGGLMLADAPLRRHLLLRVLPHVVDTVLLLSALTLSWLAQQYPFVHAWLSAKVLGLVGYIGFGTIALKRGRTRGIRIAALIAAAACAAYIVSVALSHDPRGFLAARF